MDPQIGHAHLQQRGNEAQLQFSDGVEVAEGHTTVKRSGLERSGCDGESLATRPGIDAKGFGAKMEEQRQNVNHQTRNLEK